MPPRGVAFSVLGVRVDAVDMAEAVARIEQSIRGKDIGHYVAVTGMHGIAESRRDARFCIALGRADLVVPDGMPLVWIARHRGLPLRSRVCGSELLEAFCIQTGPRYRHFFYGGGPGVARSLASKLSADCGIRVAGIFAPPYGPLTAEQELELARQVKSTSPDILWVGLGAPRQECWMLEHCESLGVPVMVGVGAAFDMVSGRIRRAPQWMQRCGLEWSYRLWKEPRRLWKRYLVTIPVAACRVVLEELQSSQLP